MKHKYFSSLTQISKQKVCGNKSKTEKKQIVSIGSHPIYSLARLSWFESSPLFLIGGWSLLPIFRFI